MKFPAALMIAATLTTCGDAHRFMALVHPDAGHGDDDPRCDPTPSAK
jgi:hypothetical protein